jgi:DNA-binding HxlR family transcriptional regulator
VKELSHVCGVGAAVDVVAGKWKTFILWVLEEKPRRFGETRRLVAGIAEKVLAQQLRELEADGVVHRRTYAELPLRVEYSLTPKGRRLMRALMLLDAWGQEHQASRSGFRLSDKGLGAPEPDSVLSAD